MEKQADFKKDDFVVHWSGRVCRVEDKAELKMMDREDNYLILRPIREEREKIYVPVRKAGESLRPVMSREEAEQVIMQLPQIEPLVIHDEKMREKEYKNAFHSGDRRARVRIVKDLYQRKQKRLQAGKKPAASDLETMLFMERSFEEELSVALGIQLEEVKTVIEEQLKDSI